MYNNIIVFKCILADILGHWKTTTETDKLKEINRNASEGIKYCNGLCQDIRKKDEFSGVHVICNNCRNFMNLAENQINERKITLENLHENPDIIYGIDITIDTMKTRVTCKQSKTMTHFDYKRNECKACRAIKTTERNNKDIDVLIADIEKLKNNIEKLEKFVIDIPKDRLIKVISYFKIDRKATDTKNTIVNNVTEYFRRIMNRNKEFKEWYRLENTKELISELEDQNLKAGYPAFKSVDITKGRYGGSWIHPDLAVQLAQWVSPKFAL